MGPIYPPPFGFAKALRQAKQESSINRPNGIRPRVGALRGPRPSPLDDSAATHTSGPERPPTNAPSIFNHRPGGNRTPNRRFWRPVLYQLSYGPNPALLAADSNSIRRSPLVPGGVADGN